MAPPAPSATQTVARCLREVLEVAARAGWPDVEAGALAVTELHEEVAACRDANDALR